MSTSRIPLGRAVAIVDPLLDALASLPGVAWAAPAGALRRGHDYIDALSIVVAADNPADTLDAFEAASRGLRLSDRGATQVTVASPDGRVTIHVVEPARAGGVLLDRTGSREHVHALMERANAQGRPLGPPGASEDDIYRALGLPPIPPELRDDDEAIRRAGDGTLPRLVSVEDLRGDLHMHTTWSDGRDAVDVMVTSCEALGYEYIAITDHSQSSAAVRNLMEDQVDRQAEEVARARERHPGISILHGCEVDILLDGALDFSDRILEKFDIVLASLHDGGGHGREQLMARYLGAMRHPLVNVITHPANRLVNRPGYDLDFDALFAAAIETGTALEIDGAPGHLDLESPLARRAAEAGVTLLIDSDCHRSERLGLQMRLGVLIARRGWIEPRHVLNTRPLAEVRAFIDAKRSSHPA